MGSWIKINLKTCVNQWINGKLFIVNQSLKDHSFSTCILFWGINITTDHIQRIFDGRILNDIVSAKLSHGKRKIGCTYCQFKDICLISTLSPEKTLLNTTFSVSSQSAVGSSICLVYNKEAKRTRKRYKQWESRTTSSK